LKKSTPAALLFSKFVKTPAGVHSDTPAAVSGVQDPDFGVQSGRLFGFFGFGLDWKAFPFQPDPDYPNEIKCGHAKNLDME